MRKPLTLLRGKLAVPVAALLATAGLAPAVMLSGPAAADEAAEEAASSASTAVTAPNSFGQDAEPLPDDSPQPAAGSDYSPDREVLDYWTPERLAEAVPYEPADDAAPGPQEAAGPGSGSSSTTDPAGTTESALPQEGAEAPRVNGKLFFNGYEVDNAYCSASAINTPTKRVVITAGHCVYQPRSGEWMQNVVFVPDYDLNKADPDPVGVWTARSLRTFDAWIAGPDYTRDVGFVTLNNGGDNNQPLVDAVGGHGLAWGGSYDFQATIQGYPSNMLVPKGRYTMHSCADTTFASTASTSKLASWEMTSVDDCNFGPGSSGGPWIYAYDQGVGYVRSVTSLWHSGTGQNWAPYFTEDVKTMMDATARD